MLPILRALNKVYGPVSVIHFDAHLDTWEGYPGTVSEQSRITHGTFFYVASEEGLISNSSIHAGIRCKLVVSETLVLLHALNAFRGSETLKMMNRLDFTSLPAMTSMITGSLQSSSASGSVLVTHLST